MKIRLAIVSLVLVAAAVLAFEVKRPGLGTYPNAAWIVRRAEEHATKHNYSATAQTKFCYRGKLVTSDVKILHKQPRKFRMEYASPPLRGVVIGNDGECMWRYDPELERLSISSEAPSCLNPTGRLDLLLHNYRIEKVGEEEVAGRRAYSLVVKAKSSGDVKKRLWVDAKTYVVLRREDYDSRGRLQSATRFNTIQYVDDLPDSQFEAPTDKYRVVSRQALGETMSSAELSKALGFAVRTPRYVPAGYKLEGYKLYKCPCECGHESAYTRYVNGLDSISIFESSVQSGCAREGRCHPPDAHRETCEVRDADHGRLASFDWKGRSFVILADVSSRELREIASSLKQ